MVEAGDQPRRLLRVSAKLIFYGLYPAVFGYIFFVWIPMRSVPRW